MKQQEFFELIDQYGISLNRLSIIIGEKSGWGGDHGIYEKDGKWFFIPQMKETTLMRLH